MDLKLFSLEAGVVSGLFLFVRMLFQMHGIGRIRLRQGLGAMAAGAARLPKNL